MIKPNLILGNCLEQMAAMPDNSVDSIVTDPPYGLSFMGKKWDYDVPSTEIWAECLRVLKPGGHLLAFAGTRTQHRMAVRIEDAGFEIRDMIAWVYGSGFPKSLDVSKAIDKAAGAVREKVMATGNPHKNRNMNDDGWSKIGEKRPTMDSAFPATDLAQQWQGWGTALKPALEPITVARKPLIGTVAANVLAHGTGAINVDGCRVEANGEKTGTNGAVGLKPENGWNKNNMSRNVCREQSTTKGRWPANLIHDGSEEVTNLMESPARFFYCAKASKRDRDEGLSSLPTVTADPYGQHRGRRMEDNDARFDGKPAAQGKNNHPTVKPTALMRYLCRLVTPPGGIVLDPFMGSGSTGKAAVLESFDFIGIELNQEYFAIAEKRVTPK